MSASTTILNLPGNSIINLGDASLPLAGASPLESRTLKSVFVNSMNKVYAYYEDAWCGTTTISPAAAAAAAAVAADNV